MQIVFAAPGPADQTVAAHLGGKLPVKEAGSCRCGDYVQSDPSAKDIS